MLSHVPLAHAPNHSRTIRTAFTLIELLVVISIIAVLISLILPAVQNARESARRMECMNHMRNVNIALLTYSTTFNGKLPYLRNDPFAPGNTSINTGTTSNPVINAVPWPVALLPYLEQETLQERLLDATNDIPSDPNSTDSLMAVGIQIYTCPDDPDADGAGTLSFVANAGITTSEVWNAPSLCDVFDILAPQTATGYDWSFNGYGVVNADDHRVTRGSGVFFQEFHSGGFRSSLDYLSVGDGQSNTILFTENLQATCWAIGDLSDISFVVPVESLDQNTIASNESIVNGLGPEPDRPKTEAMDFEMNGYNLAANPGFLSARINADPVSALEGGRPRPSSFHPGLVNGFFGDGHGRVISQSIDDSVYLRLVTTWGERYGQTILGNGGF